MASVYSKRLFVGSVAPGGNTTLLTAPSALTTVVRSFSFVPTGGVSPWTLYLIVNGFNVWAMTGTVATAVYEEPDIRIVLNPGDTLVASTGAGGFNGQVSGFELS